MVNVRVDAGVLVKVWVALGKVRADAGKSESKDGRRCW